MTVQKRSVEDTHGPALESLAIVPVITIDVASDAEPVVWVLYESGIRSIELTLRTPVAYDAIRVAKASCPDMLVGAGTVLSPDQLEKAIDYGADFGLSPGLNGSVVEHALGLRFPFVPGISTPTEIESALSYGFRFLKFFPAEPLGGETYLRAIAAPYEHLSVTFLPLGGVDESNLEQYLQLAAVGAIGGSWIAPRPIIRSRNWSQIKVSALAALSRSSRARVERGL